jgi:putative membrane protein
VRGVKRLSLLLIVSVAVLATLLFSLENQQSVSLTFLGWAAPQWSVSVYILGALLLGLMVGPILGFAIHRRKRHPLLK